MKNPVELLQTKLGVTADGDFGPKTSKAFRDHYNLSNSEAAHFLGQCYHETGGFKVFEENLNYSKEGLLRVFPKYFTPQEAALYARLPKKIASRVYANRMGNGDEASGDGWTYRGRGAIQLTGKSNYQSYRGIGNEDSLLTDKAFDVALWYFKSRRIWPLCSEVTLYNIGRVTRKINGGTNGIDDRIKHTNKFYAWLSK